MNKLHTTKGVLRGAWNGLLRDEAGIIHIFFVQLLAFR